FESREVQSWEGGVKYGSGSIGATVNGFYTKLKNVTSQGAEVDPITGATHWNIQPQPESRSYGAEVEGFISPLEGLQFIGSGTVMNAEIGAGAPDTLLVSGGPFPLVSKLLNIAPN